MKRGRTYILGLLIMLLAPLSANAQWSFDVGTVEAYINDHKQQRSLLLAAPPCNTAINCCMSTAARKWWVIRN